MDTMSRALRRAARSPFSAGIERAPMPDRFTRPQFNSYDRKTDSVQHKGTIHNFAELIQEFGIRFVTCSRVPQSVDALLSMKMRVGETLHSYVGQYWKLYNKIGGGNEKIAASTFRMGLPEDSELRKSLTKKPPEDMRQLMRCIEEYKRLEDDWLQSRGKVLAINRPQQNNYPPRIRGNLRIQEPKAQVEEVNVTFKELVHRIVDKFKHESYFKWLNKMGGDPSRRNQNLYCTYHKDKVHTTEQCQVLRDNLEQLAKAGHLKEFVMDAGDRGTGQDAPQRANPLPPPFGIIEVIHAAPKSLTAVGRKEVLTVVSVEGSSDVLPPKKKMKPTRELIAFDNNNLKERFSRTTTH
ncbi:uncharacterized protein LOC111990521 [Quercus suber]|uniref:uncharacterized protein LOC111990521 n=1 Tax=Quercus suber TaxID=58331 RepID=UPI000CE255A8|nr:uncharacterized protein LOC111990521 [Quercus suber]